MQTVKVLFLFKNVLNNQLKEEDETKIFDSFHNFSYFHIDDLKPGQRIPLTFEFLLIDFWNQIVSSYNFRSKNKLFFFNSFQVRQKFLN